MIFQATILFEFIFKKNSFCVEKNIDTQILFTMIWWARQLKLFKRIDDYVI